MTSAAVWLCLFAGGLLVGWACFLLGFACGGRLWGTGFRGSGLLGFGGRGRFGGLLRLSVPIRDDVHFLMII